MSYVLWLNRFHSSNHLFFFLFFPLNFQVLSTMSCHYATNVFVCVVIQIVEMDKLAPETWCVVGNCFSLQREPDSALRYFHRALQLDPSFAYAHTLCGHEYVSNEDLDKATASFRHAIASNERHYNAWYGLGSIYFRQEKYDLAEYHFRRAIAINGSSSVLQCYLGMVLHAHGDRERVLEALTVLGDASDRDPTNPQVSKHQLATVS